EAALRFDGRAEPEGTIADALKKMERASGRHAVQSATAGILVAAPAGQDYTIDQWWRALEGAGLVWGDGDLFWLPLGDGELCAEPYTRQAYFHPGDRASGRVRLPDVQLHVRVR